MCVNVFGWTSLWCVQFHGEQVSNLLSSFRASRSVMFCTGT